MNARTFAAATLAIGCTLTATSGANAATYRTMNPHNLTAQPTPHLRLAPLHVRCAAAGSPDFVHTALLFNDGVRPVPAGSKVRWRMNHRSGYYTFASVLPLHKAVAFDLHFTTAAAQPCVANFLP